MNKFMVMGRLTKDPDVRMANDKKIVRIDVAVDGRDGKTDFFSFTAFGKNAENLERYFCKGKPILVHGRVENNNYEKDGKKVYGFNFVLEQFEFVLSDKTATGNGSAPAQEQTTTGNEFMTIPDDVADDGLPFN